MIDFFAPLCTTVVIRFLWSHITIIMGNLRTEVVEVVSVVFYAKRRDF